MRTPSDTASVTDSLRRRHVMPDFGLPYASAEFDADGHYHVVCPCCGFRCYPEGGMGEATQEDDTTKGATRVYGLHFEAESRKEQA